MSSIEVRVRVFCLLCNSPVPQVSRCMRQLHNLGSSFSRTTTHHLYSTSSSLIMGNLSEQEQRDVNEELWQAAKRGDLAACQA